MEDNAQNDIDPLTGRKILRKWLSAAIPDEILHILETIHVKNHYGHIRINDKLVNFTRTFMESKGFKTASEYMSSARITMSSHHYNIEPTLTNASMLNPTLDPTHTIGHHQDDQGVTSERFVHTAVYYIEKTPEISGGNLFVYPDDMFTPGPPYLKRGEGVEIKVHSGLMVLMSGDIFHSVSGMTSKVSGVRRSIVVQIPRDE